MALLLYSTNGNNVHAARAGGGPLLQLHYSVTTSIGARHIVT